MDFMDLKIDPHAAQRVRQDINLENSIKKMKKVIAVQSGKGGVGKSTVTLNMAIAFANKGYRVGVIDADVTGPSIPIMAGLIGQDAEIKGAKIIPFKAHGVQIVSMDLLLQANTPVIWRGPLKIAAIRQFLADVAWEEMDILFLDLPPGTSDEPLTVSQMFENITGTVIVSTPQQVSVHDVRKSIGFASKVNMPIIGLIENMSGLSCPHCSNHIDVFSKGGGKDAAMDLGVNFLGEIPLDPQVVLQADKGTPSVNVPGPFKDAFDAITDKVANIIGLE
ncbi:MAG: Mrp/NBP35 family ATP-binding protein [Candidatus Heimdallarchaeota archaeon]|nr:Mrp/NBP35 family ATP-binding protein [Candidatus Heimdallarchaeota archaeon]